MVRKKALSTFVLFAWALLVFGGTVAVFSGRAAPLVTPEMLPVGGPIGMVVFAGGLLVVGGVVIALLKRRAWRRAGRRANLTPEGGGLLGKPALVGTENGRTVRARTIKRQTGGGGESGSNKSTFTVVEADLDGPATDGLVISNGNEDIADIGGMPVNLETDTVGEFAVVGTSEGLARETLTTRAQNELRDEIAGDAGTVRVETEGLLLDSEELDRQLTAVAAVADGFVAIRRRNPKFQYCYPPGRDLVKSWRHKPGVSRAERTPLVSWRFTESRPGG